MRFIKLLVTLFLFFAGTAVAQNKQLISGPWAGNVELRNASIWAEVSSSVKSVAIKFSPTNNTGASKTITHKGSLGNDFNPVKIELNWLEPNTTYQYSIIIDGKVVATPFVTKFTTKD